MARPPHKPRLANDPTISPASIAARETNGETAGNLTPPDDTDELPAGTRLGKYTVRFALGRGGMGTVYEAMDAVLHRKVALKVLPKRFAENPEALKRFVREAQLAARLNHPNAVMVYDVAKKDSTYFIAMELVPGTSGQELLIRGTPLDWRDATRAIADACRALGAAHVAGLVHRDIKPSNLLWSESGSVKLSDFGLAKPTDPRSVTLTQQDAVIGTPLYMSPEQCRNEGVDARSDIYSMGATYFALLTGAAPYEKGTALQILFAHCSAPIPDASEIRAGLPQSCAAVIRRAMAKDPKDRYQSAGEMVCDLEALLAGETVSSSASEFSGIAVLAMSDSAGSINLPDVGRSQTFMVDQRMWTYGLVAAGVIVLLLGGVLVALLTRNGPTPTGDAGTSTAEKRPSAPAYVPPPSPSLPVAPAYVETNAPVIVAGPVPPSQIPSAGVVRPNEPPTPANESVKPVEPSTARVDTFEPSNTIVALVPLVPPAEKPVNASNEPSSVTSKAQAPIAPSAESNLSRATSDVAEPEPAKNPVDIAEASQHEPVLKRYLAVRLYTLNARKSTNTVSQLKAAKALVLWHDFFLKIPDPQAHHEMLARESLSLAEELSPGISEKMPRETPGVSGPPLPPTGPPRQRPENAGDPDRPRDRRPPPPRDR